MMASVIENIEMSTIKTKWVNYISENWPFWKQRVQEGKQCKEIIEQAKTHKEL
jgi:hypothetical protein